MLTVSLLSDPGRPGLGQQLVEEVSRNWNGTAPVWLARDTACEFIVAARPADFNDVRTELDASGIDLNILPVSGRRKKLLVADMDSTIIEQECLDELADEAGIGETVKEITAQAMNGEINFSEALRKRVSLLKGKSHGMVETVWRRRITCTPGADALVATMKLHGARAVLISGGFTDFTGRVASLLGFDEHFANVLHVEDGLLAGTVQEPPLGRSAKKEILLRVLQRLGQHADTVVAVGDGSNDIEMLGLAGLGVAFRAKPAVNRTTDIQVRHCDLTGLLYLQGFARTEFAKSS